MRYFKRKAILSILFLFCGVVVLISGLLKLTMNNYSAATFQILVALFFAFDAYVYKKPYLGLDEGKLIVNVGRSKIEVLLKDITSVNQKDKRLTIIYSQGSSTMKLKILLSHLKKHDKEQFIKDLKSKLGAKFCVG